MILAEIAAAALLAQAPIVVTGDSGVGYEALMEGEVATAITEIEANQTLEADDPARLINLGVAYAWLGQTANARAAFETAMRGEERVNLETSDGEWKDSRHLARLALKKLDNGELHNLRMASR